MRSSPAIDAPPADPAALSPRGHFEGVGNVVRFNWPLYAVGLLIAIGALAVAWYVPSPHWLRWTFVLAGAAALYLLLASLVASYWIYDRSPLYRFAWATRLAGDSPTSVLNLHSGFDESSIALRRAFPNGTFEVLDFYNPQRMTEPSIVRARRYQARTAPPWLASITRSTGPTTLPVASGSVDVAFAILAAHEIRQPEDRKRFFIELARSLRPGGCVVLVEHLRDPANFLAFGPQFVHFYSRRTWLDLARGAGLTVIHQSRITPFVGVFAFEKPA